MKRTGCLVFSYLVWHYEKPRATSKFLEVLVQPGIRIGSSPTFSLQPLIHSLFIKAPLNNKNDLQFKPSSSVSWNYEPLSRASSLPLSEIEPYPST
jgi:hypothetical protein